MFYKYFFFHFLFPYESLVKHSCNGFATNSENQLILVLQDPCDKLREIVRSGYFHMDQDNLLNSSDLTDFNAELPLSPAVCYFFLLNMEHFNHRM